jgi:tetratricopeptide (TPR) repeat protein
VATDRDSEDSLERLRTVVRANPRSTTFVALAHALCDAGRDDEAEEVCRQGLGQHPRLVTGQVALGRALLQRGRLREAQDVLVDAAKSSPEHGDAFRWLGELSLRKGDPDHARPILEYAEELMPTDAQVADLLVQAGGKPLPRVSRPKTDFEHTRVGNARKLAERMHEDPPTPPTTVSRVDPADLDDKTPAVTLRGDGTIDAATPVRGTGTRESSNAPARLWQRLRSLPRWQRLALGAIPVVALVLVLMKLLPGGKTSAPPPPVATAPAKAPAPPPVDFKAAIAAGTLDGLQDARAKGRRLLATQALDPDGAAELALVNALLASEHGQSTVADAEEAAATALAAKPVLARTGLTESARALAALAAGRLAQAKEAVGRARTAAPDLAETRFAAGRVNVHLGAVDEARADLEAATRAAPKLIAARLDLAALRIDAGEPKAAIADLEALLAADKELLRARLLLAEARRAALMPSVDDGLREACREGRRESGVLRAACAFDRAAAARLEGDRGEALKSARASVAARGRHVNVRAIAQGVLMMATLGDVDNAGEAMRKIREETEPAFVPRAWADMAAALARADKLTATDLLDRPSGPEARFLVARAAFAQGGGKALGEALAKLGPDAVAFDPDLKVFATLVDEGKLSDETRKQLSAAADKGNSLASYVLGRHALAMGNKKKAAERLAKALQGHGDSCEAAHMLLAIDRKQRPSAVNSEAKVAKLVRGRNGGCSYFAKSK